MSHILITLSMPELNRVLSSCSRAMVQTAQLWPVRVLIEAELYFLVRLHTLIVRSELPEMRVWPLVVHSRQRMSLMWPEKFLVFSPFSQSHIFMLQSALPEAKVVLSFRYLSAMIEEVWPERTLSAVKMGALLAAFLDIWLTCESCIMDEERSPSLTGSGHILMVLSQEPVTSLLLGSTIMQRTPPTWHWQEPIFSKVVMSNMLREPSSEPVMIFLSGSLQIAYTVRLWCEGNVADLAYFFTPATETVDRGSSTALGLMSLAVSARFEFLWSPISRGPAWLSLFQNTVKQDFMPSNLLQSTSGVSSCIEIRFSQSF